MLVEAGAAEHDHGCNVLVRVSADWHVTTEFGGPLDCWRFIPKDLAT